MIQIQDKRLCTGCGVCSIVCPVNAIVLKEDQEGFEYPYINIDKCIECGKCKKVCHMHQDLKRKENAEYYAGYLKQSELLEAVSSGGAAWALTLEVLNCGGIVYGAVQEGTDIVRHMRAQTVEEAQKFRRSKYLPSVLGNCYEEVKHDLEMDKKVLFTGTACQIAGLYAYLKTDYANLYTCDVICHGIPSMKVFRKYKEETEKKYKAEIENIVFRDKTYGWDRNHYKIRFTDGRTIYESSRTQLFHSGYLQGIFYRPSCGNCKYASLYRTSDVTLADFWKYEGKLKEKNENKGISLIICNSKKGKQLFEQASRVMSIEKSSKEEACRSCRHLTKTPVENKKRHKFFQLLDKKGYCYAAYMCMPKRMIIYTVIEQIRRKLNGRKK